LVVEKRVLGTRVPPDNLAILVDAKRRIINGTGEIECGQLTFVIEKAV